MTIEPTLTDSTTDPNGDDFVNIERDMEMHGPALQGIDLRMFSRLSRRVCLIRRTEAPDSTGFLVGPDLMLTAAHNLIGTTGIFVDPVEVTILFDQFIWDKRRRRRAHGDQCGLRAIPFSKPRQPDIVASSIRTDAKCRTFKRDTGLDYALVRLDRPMGLSYLPYSPRIRGWTDCSVARIPAVGPVFVVQHPLGGLQQFADGEIRPEEMHPEPKTPFRYYTAALSGTSGSPVVNRDRRVVGLHVGERVETKDEQKTTEGKDVHQLGVSLQRILADIHEQKVSLPSNNLDREVLNRIFGSSQVERDRYPEGKHWGGDRLFHKP